MNSKEWQLLPLEDCMDAIIDYRGKTPRKSSFGIPLITAKIVKGGRILEPTEFIPYEDYDERMSRGIPQAGDVVVTTEAPLGEVGQLDNRKLSVGQRLITLRGKSGFLDNTYLKYLMMSDFVQNQLLARATGTTVVGIKQTELRKIDLVIPPLPSQHTIANILGALDDKIETNRRMNNTLESITQTIFRQWFLDDEEVKEWDTVEIGDIVDIRRGASPRPIQEFMGGDIPWLKIADATNARAPFILRTKEFVTKPGSERSVFVKPGDLILSNSATCGLPFFVDLHGCIHDGWLLFRNEKQVSKWFLYHQFLVISEHLIHIADGSVQKNLNTNLVATQKIHLPPASKIEAFDSIAQPIFEKIRTNLHESRTLTYLRDSLLPKLMNGEIEV